MSNIAINSIHKHLDQATKEIDSASDNIEINSIVENLIASIAGSERASVWIYDSAKLILYRERDNGTSTEINTDLKRGLIYKCFATKKPSIYNYLTSEKGYDATVDNSDNIRIKCKIMLPLIDKGHFIGIASAYSSARQITNFDKDNLEVLQAIAPYIINIIYRMSENHTEFTPIKKEKSEPKKSHNLDIGSEAEHKSHDGESHNEEPQERQIDRANRSDGKFNRRSSDRTTENFQRRSSDTIDNLNDIQRSRENTQTPQEILDFVANVVHDIRTPANGLFGFLEILEEQIEDDRLREYISHAKSSANLVNELTTSILDGMSSKRETEDSKPEVVSSASYFADIAEIFSSNMYKKQIDYSIYIDPSLPKEIVVDKLKLKRIIMNIIGNAYKFTKEYQNIEFSIRYKQKDKRVHIFVKDTGIGIAKEKQEQIFEAFQQAEEHTNLNYGGTGLGLAISAGYVNELGGKLLIESELDKGSTFYFDIPVTVADSDVRYPAISATSVHLAILMDGKNKIVANVIARYLVKMGLNKAKINAVTNIDSIDPKVTHIIAFQDKMDDRLDTFISRESKKLLVVEEKFLSLNKDRLGDVELISQYGYYADTLYTFIDVAQMPRVLIADDDEISVTLIKTMLRDEMCEIDVAYNGNTARDFLLKSAESGSFYSIVFLDSNMPFLSGIEVLKEFREVEAKQGDRVTVAVSISGDVHSKETHSDFDIYVGKPFDKSEIKAVFSAATK